MNQVTLFARAGALALSELVASLPDDVQQHLADAVAGGARLAIGMAMDGQGGSLVYLDLIDAADTAHRITHIPAAKLNRH
jgi:hypothetical protein